MKKTFCITIVLVLLATLFATSAAFADSTPKYNTTKCFIKALENEGLKYSYEGVDSYGKDRIRVGWDDDDFEVTAYIIFSDNNMVSIRFWNVLTYSCGVNYAYQICDNLNGSYKFATFEVDESDNSITVSHDTIISADVTEASHAVEILERMASIIDSAREDLLKLK